ncbi:MAG: EamA family transporter [Lentisphaeria bacterium]|nr:EamA family transporter [Lentisphaeria bacterium]
MAVVFALCCLACAACNDFVFKLFTRVERSKGQFVALVGILWFLTLVWLPRDPANDWKMTLLWGGISGFLSLTSNILLIEAMARQSAGLCSTIFRLNMVLVVLGATFILNEKLTGLQWVGIGLAILAVLAFIPRKSGSEAAKKAGMIGFGMVLLAAFLRAGMGLSYKYGFLHGADQNGVAVVNSFFWIFGGLLYAFLVERNFKFPDKLLLGYGALSGVLVAGIVFFMAASVNLGNASIVLPIAQMSFLGTLLLSVLFLKEKVDILKIIAVLSGTAAILLLVQ